MPEKDEEPRRGKKLSTTERKRRRARLKKEQKAILEQELSLKPNWDTNDTRRIAEKLGINRIKVYKWHYDQKKAKKVTQIKFVDQLNGPDKKLKLEPKIR